MTRIHVYAGMSILMAGMSAQHVHASEAVFSNQFESGAVGLSPELVFVRAGDTTSGIAGPMVLQLDAPAEVNTFVPIVSLDPTRLTVDGGGVMVPQGQSTAIVTMTGIASSSTPVLLRTGSGNHVYASVRVFDDAESRQVVSLQPSQLRIAPGGQRELTATLNLPAPAGGSLIDLTVSPSGAGNFTTPISVAANGFSQSFVYTDNDISESATLSATVAMTTAAQANVTQAPIGKLVINEIDYDQPGTDSGEFVEIHNRSPDIVPLDGIHLMLVNGSTNPSSTYLDIDLSEATSQLASGSYLVVGHSSVPIPDGTPFIAFANADANLQNGSPDGVAIVDTEALAVIDAFSYEGGISQANLPGFPAPVSLIEGSVFNPNFMDSDDHRTSMARWTNGKDNNNAASDFWLTETPTPGECNRLYPTDHLVINEVDYDQPVTDAYEFVEIYNGTCEPVALANYRLAFINGGLANPTSYRVINLGDAGTSLAPGQFLVIRSSNVFVPPSELTITFGSLQNNIQNGAPDGLALIDVSGPTLVDALSYGGYVTNATVNGVVGNFNLVEGTVLSSWRWDDDLVTRSLARTPNGYDTDNADGDWISSAYVTPGAPNSPSDNETDDIRELFGCLVSSPASITVAVGQATPEIFIEAYEADVTEAEGPAPGVIAAVGFGGGNPLFPAQNWTFLTATYISQNGYADRYAVSFTPLAPGIYSYVGRFSTDGGKHWTYCDLNGAGAANLFIFESNQLGTLTVTP